MNDELCRKCCVRHILLDRHVLHKDYVSPDRTGISVSMQSVTVLVRQNLLDRHSPSHPCMRV
eukprot:scaffold8933_cov23-Tisochrysis_lutea.AAC.1